VGVGDMRNVSGRYRAAIDDLKASRILEWCEGELVMAGKVLVHDSDSRGFAVNQRVCSNGLVAEGNIAQHNQMFSFHCYFRN